MCELEKSYLDVKTESSPLVVDESHCPTATIKSHSVSISENNESEIDIKVKSKPQLSIGSTSYKNCNPEAKLFNQKPLSPRIEIITANECCDSVTHQCFIFPPQTPIKVTIETGSDTHFIETGADSRLNLYPFGKLKNWFHQYLTLWFFLLISLIQISLTYHQDGASIESGVSYIIQPLASNGLQEDNIRVYPCGHTSPSS